MTSDLNFEARCFKNSSVSYEILDDETVEITLANYSPKNLFCEDLYLFATVENYHLELAFFHGFYLFFLEFFLIKFFF